MFGCVCVRACVCRHVCVWTSVCVGVNVQRVKFTDVSIVRCTNTNSTTHLVPVLQY